MVTIVVSNRDIAKKLVGISAGDEIQFTKGKYRESVVITGVAGTQDRPLTFGPAAGISSGDVVFKSGVSESAARTWANGVAHGRQSAGYYPTFGHLGDQAMLVLRNCQYVVLRGLDFEDCWPTAIYLDNCQHVMIHDVRFRRGTIAIGANGIDTHDVIVQHCHWQQDRSGSDMWNKIPWGRIHGASDNSKNPDVDIGMETSFVPGISMATSSFAKTKLKMHSTAFIFSIVLTNSVLVLRQIISPSTADANLLQMY